MFMGVTRMIIATNIIIEMIETATSIMMRIRKAIISYDG
jgi:hypothetical protein